MTDVDERDDGMEQTAPVWAVFGDLMAGLLGAFVLVLVGVLVVQMDLVANLNAEIEKRQAAVQRRMSLEKALAIPLQTGRVTLNNGRIGISGNVLFPVNSDELRPEGRQLLKSLVAPLEVYLGERDEMLMVSGFTDDRRVTQGNQRYVDNLELSAQRALTVTRALTEEGMPASRVFAAAFGAEQPVASNADEKGRAQNRRVEMAPVPKAANTPTSTPPPAPATPRPRRTRSRTPLLHCRLHWPPCAARVRSSSTRRVSITSRCCCSACPPSPTPCATSCRAACSRHWPTTRSVSRRPTQRPATWCKSCRASTRSARLRCAACWHWATPKPSTTWRRPRQPWPPPHRPRPLRSWCS